MNKRRKAGFNLVELLGVMGVFAVAGVIAMPAWNEARTAARRAACASNLRQMHAAYMAYLADHSGVTFPWLVRTNGMDWWYWGLERNPGAPEGRREIDRSQGYLAPYIDEGQVTTCPEFPFRATYYKQKFETSTYGYGLNFYLIRQMPGAVDNFARVERPAETILWGDAAQVTTRPPASSRNPLLEEWYYISPVELTTHFRHARKAQTVMADGAVRSFDPERLDPNCGGLVGRIASAPYYLRPVK